MTLLLALVPILCIFLLLFVFKQTSLRTSVFSYIVTLIITLTVNSYQVNMHDIMQSSLKGALISFIAAYVLFFGILLFHLMNNVGGIDAIASFISKTTNDSVMQVIILVIGLSPLLESTSGFGIAFMVTAPILIALGFSRLKAALIGLISLLAVPWGALATGTVIGAEIGGVSLQKLGTGSAIISIPVFIYFLFTAVFLINGWDAIKKKWKELLLFSSLFSISMLIFNIWISVELAGVLSSLVTTGLGLLFIKISASKKMKSNITTSQTSSTYENTEMGIIKIMSPYLILTIFIFLSRLISPLKEFLNTHFVIHLPALSFSMALLYSPGFWLCITCLFTIYIFKIKKEIIWESLKSTIKQWIPFTISTTAFVAISEVMSVAGMTDTIATAAGVLFGTSFIFISPFIGGIGGFLTGSNTGSNAMFINLQVQTAHQVGLSKELIANIQNVSSSHSTMACPSRVMLAANLCEIKSEENEILKRITLIGLGAIVLIMITAVLVQKL
ncbi:L-lactate permease [Bacillus sp. S10(2024)]|uniref:L-lactate permease n=1 Tax=Bacillus sp. S10(2024) TaxID=3162886 RepID=UPI003D1FB5A9